MISLVTDENSAAFHAACDRDLVMGPEVATLQRVYGGYSHMANFWVEVTQGHPASAISRENGQIKLVLTPYSDAGEVRGFLDTLGGFDQVWAEVGMVARLYPGAPFRSGPVMRYPGGTTGADHAGVAGDLPLDDLYGLLCTCFDEFDAAGRERWCAYASHLFRHGLGSVAGIYDGQGLACTGGIYAANRRFATIACVATRRDARGQGLAARVVRCLCDSALQSGKTPSLLCAGDELADYYSRLGFEKVGRWARLGT